MNYLTDVEEGNNNSGAGEFNEGEIIDKKIHIKRKGKYNDL